MLRIPGPGVVGCRETSTGQHRHRIRRVRPEWELLYCGLSCIDSINIYRICQPALFVPRQIMLSDSTKQLLMHWGIRCSEFATTTVSCLLTITVSVPSSWEEDEVLQHKINIYFIFANIQSVWRTSLPRLICSLDFSIALEVVFRFIFSVFQPPVCFVSKICIKVIVLNKADLETRQ